MAYWQAVKRARYWPTLPGPIAIILSFVLPLEDIHYSQLILFLAGIFWLVGTAVWFPYDLLNEELEKRDAENLRRTPAQRIDRAYHLLTELLLEGQKLLQWNAGTERIRAWDERVRMTLAQWYTPATLQLYLLNTRPRNQEYLEEAPKAIDELKMFLRQPDLYVK